MCLLNVHWAMLQEKEGKCVEWEEKEKLGTTNQLPWSQEAPGAVWGGPAAAVGTPILCQPWSCTPGHRLHPAPPRKGGSQGQAWFASPWRYPNFQEIKKAFPLKSAGLFFFGNIKERQGRRVRGLGSRIFILFVASFSCFLGEPWVAEPDLFLSCMSIHSKKK